MPPKSKYSLGEHRQNANRVFTNRDNPIRWFNEARSDLQKGKHQLLTFYGVGGQGKSALCRKLGDILKEEDPKTAIWGQVDFAAPTYRRADRALLELRKTLVTNSKGKIKFPAFEIAITHYWEKEYPESNVKESLKDVFDKNENVIASIVDNTPNWLEHWLEFAEELPTGIGTGIKFLNFLRHKEREVRYKRALEALSDLEQLKNYKLLEKLPYIFASDVLTYLEQDASLKPVIFIDTFEALWENYQVKTGFGATEADVWVRNLVAELPGTLFVIFGRDKLTWDVDFPKDWVGYLENQHLLGGLSDQDADEFLTNIPISDATIRAAMIKGAQGEVKEVGQAKMGAHPFYLDLAVDLYLDMLDDGKQPTPEDIGHNHRDLLDRFVRYRSVEEIETLKALSVAYGFDRAIFEHIIKHFQTGYPTTAFIEFTHYSFIEQGQDGRYYMHALMRESLTSALNKETFAQIRECLFNYYNAMLPKEVNEVIEQHDIILQQAVRYLDWQGLDKDEWINTQFHLFYDAARYAPLIPILTEDLFYCEKTLPEHHLRITVLLNSLASIYFLQANYTAAEPLYQRALAIHEKTPPADNLNIASSLNGLASLYANQYNYEAAEPLYKRALVIYEKALPADHSDIAYTLENMACLYCDQAKYDDAEPLHKRALAIYEKALPADHPDIGTILNNMANFYFRQAKYEDAEPLYKRALAIYEKALPADHSSIALILNGSASLYYKQGKYAVAEPLYQRALAIREKKLSADHPDIAKSLSGLASLYHSQSNYTAAEPLYKRALVIYEKALPADHPYIAAILNNVANLYYNQGNYTAAEPLYKRALAIREKAMSLDDGNGDEVCID